MNSKSTKHNKAADVYYMSVDTFIERMKKINALNCNPCDIGINSYLWKSLTPRRINRIEKIL